MAKLTAVTIARDEETHLARALESVQGLADELVVVVDAATTDRTFEIAMRYTDKVYTRPWSGFGPQKNFALSHATGDWVLFLDADEEVTPALAAEIRAVVRHPRAADCQPPTVYFVKIITVFLGKPLRHLWGTNPRLFRREAVRWDDRAVHEQLVRPDGSTVRLGDSDTGQLTAPLLHPSHYTTLAAYLEKRARYTTRDAEEMCKTGRDRLGRPMVDPRRSPLTTLRFLSERPVKQFLRLFVKKRGFLDGWRGLLWIFLSVQYEHMVSRKYLALKRKSQNAEPQQQSQRILYSFILLFCVLPFTF